MSIKKEFANRISITGVMIKKQLNTNFESLERSHDNLYPQIGSKSISKLLASRFRPNRFHLNLDLTLFA